MRRRLRGLTLIELLIVIVVLGTLVALVAPSFREMIVMQRLRGINAQLVTDLQFARAEAATRNEWVRIWLAGNTQQTCYTIYTSTSNARRCDCTLGAGSACTDAATREVRTHNVLRSTGVRLAVPTGQALGFAFDNVSGGISSIPTDFDSAPLSAFRVIVLADTPRTLWNTINQAGRVTVCAPTGSRVQEPPC